MKSVYPERILVRTHKSFSLRVFGEFFGRFSRGILKEILKDFLKQSIKDKEKEEIAGGIPKDIPRGFLQKSTEEFLIISIEKFSKLIL